MLKWLLSSLMASGVGEQFNGGTGGDLASLTAALRGAKDKKKGEQSLTRLQDAFKQLKDMHKDDKPFDFENAQWPYGPIGAPSQAMAQAPSGPTSQGGAPLPMSGPTSVGGAPLGMQGPTSVGGAPLSMSGAGPQAPQTSPFADFFARNTAMMKDPTSGEFIDPSAAAKHGGSGILNGLFG